MTHDPRAARAGAGMEAPLALCIDQLRWPAATPERVANKKSDTEIKRWKQTQNRQTEKQQQQQQQNGNWAAICNSEAGARARGRERERACVWAISCTISSVHSVNKNLSFTCSQTETFLPPPCCSISPQQTKAASCRHCNFHEHLTGSLCTHAHADTHTHTLTHRGSST